MRKILFTISIFLLGTVLLVTAYVNLPKPDLETKFVQNVRETKQATLQLKKEGKYALLTRSYFKTVILSLTKNQIPAFAGMTVGVLK